MRCASLPSAALALALALAVVSDARAESSGYRPRFEVELLTIDPGDEAVNMFGHSALRVVDHRIGADWVFNWGTLYWAPDIPRRFVAGPMSYFLGMEDFNETLAFYRSENRRMVGQRLELSQEHAALLVSEVIRNAQPDRSEYLYHHFDDNCATRVRDVLDRHSGGALRRAGHGMSGRTYREHLYFGSAPPGAIVMGFDVLANASWDREPNDWRATFLPARLHALASRATLADGRPLVVGEEVHLEREGPPPGRVAMRPGWYAFAVPALLLLLALLLPRPRKVARVCGVTGFIVGGLLLGLAGVAGVAAWLFTAHTDFELNEALLHVWPTDIALVVLGPKALGKGARRAAFTARYLLVHAVVSALALLLLAVGVLHQQLWPVAVPTLTLLVVAALLTRRAAKG